MSAIFEPNGIYTIADVQLMLGESTGAEAFLKWLGVSPRFEQLILGRDIVRGLERIAAQTAGGETESSLCRAWLSQIVAKLPPKVAGPSDGVKQWRDMNPTLLTAYALHLFLLDTAEAKKWDEELDRKDGPRIQGIRTLLEGFAEVRDKYEAKAKPKLESDVCKAWHEKHGRGLLSINSKPYATSTEDSYRSADEIYYGTRIVDPVTECQR